MTSKITKYFLVIYKFYSFPSGRRILRSLHLNKPGWAMVQKFLISCFFFLFSYSSFSQTDSCHLRVSLLTCSAGEELYSTFGHSALRVTDSVTNEDIVYNYGTFNFDEPGFYTKFIRGKLMYYISTEDFSSFKQTYQQDKRNMIEQVLNLSCNEKQKMVSLLQQNLMAENKFYKYDFLFDNCTTRLRDLLEKSADTTIHFKPVINKPATFRQFIFEYMDYNDNQWGKFGMNLLLGNKTDAIMNNRQTMFLPDYLMRGFDKGTIGSKQIVSSTNKILDLPIEIKKTSFFTHPLFIFSVLFLGVALMSFSKNNSIQKLLFGLDGFIFFIVGFIGCLIVFMWFGTNHIVCRNNYNILWALPTHVAAAFLINSKKRWAKKYFLVTSIFNLLVLLAWFFLPQQMNISFIPIVLILIVRGFANTKDYASLL